MKHTTPEQSTPGQGTPLAVVTLSGVDVKIAGNTILRSLNWKLQRGEHWAVVGANGSGKTSFLKLISGTLWPAPGNGKRRYNFGSELQTDAVEALRKITLVGHELQDHYIRLGWNFSAVEVVLSGIFRTNIPRRRASKKEGAQARNLLEKFHLNHLADRHFLELSRGEQRRVLIARALAFKPQILLLDEPSAGLDHSARKTLNDTIDDISRHTTIIFSSHRSRGIPLCVNKTLYIEGGQISEKKPGKQTGGISDLPDVESAQETPEKILITDTRNIAEPEILIEIDNANVWVKERKIISDLNWRLLEGQHWHIAGANGSGKTTFLRLLHGQLRPALAGSIRWVGLGNPSNIWALRRLVGWVSPELQADYRYAATVQDCVASGIDSSLGLIRPVKQEERILVTSAVEDLELQQLAERSVRTLSYGQFKRTLIARALVNRPKILLLDEPWEGLDPDAIELLGGKLQDISERGTQLICASHLDIAQGWFTHRLTLKNGHVLSMTPLQEGGQSEQ